MTSGGSKDSTNCHNNVLASKPSTRFWNQIKVYKHSHFQYLYINIKSMYIMRLIGLCFNYKNDEKLPYLYQWEDNLYFFNFDLITNIPTWYKRIQNNLCIRITDQIAPILTCDNNHGHHFAVVFVLAGGLVAQWYQKTSTVQSSNTLQYWVIKYLVGLRLPRGQRSVVALAECITT